MHGRGMALPAAAAPACLHASVCAASSCVMLPGQPYDRASALTLRQCSRPCGVERVHGGGGVVAAATAAAAAAQVHATRNQAALWAVYIHAFCCCFSNEGCYLQVLGRLVPACYGRG